ncbi:hypothetical protein [Planomicrobium okeanokoites]|uniref:hypothetical protein n=1 Tax=Planomicrobium okeanokoites TaxID=244 RepID=UPI0024915993|nr:hypothetical protein [Planomicrobium okeanokoites]
MKTFKNEKGYALLMVLMLILLFTVLGMGLMATNMNLAKQFSTKENQVQARHQAEMGVLHYGVVLEDKVKRSSATAISCSDVEKLLGPSKKLSEGKYYIEPASGSTSCKEIDSSKLLEVTIKSTGIIDGNTNKKVEATFYIENTGSESEETIVSPNPPLPPKNEEDIIRDLGKDCNGGGNNCTYDTYTPNKFVILDELETKKHSFHFKDHLTVNRVIIEGGNSDDIKVNKNLYITESLFIQNHACIAVGGDLFIGKSLTNTNKEKTDIYVYGDFYLPTEHTGVFDFDIHVKGQLYQFNPSTKSYSKNESKSSFGIKEMPTNSLLNKCSVSEYDSPSTSGQPEWILSDDTNIIYN